MNYADYIYRNFPNKRKNRNHRPTEKNTISPGHHRKQKLIIRRPRPCRNFIKLNQIDISARSHITHIHTYPRQQAYTLISINFTQKLELVQLFTFANNPPRSLFFRPPAPSLSHTLSPPTLSREGARHQRQRRRRKEVSISFVAVVRSALIYIAAESARAKIPVGKVVCREEKTERERPVIIRGKLRAQSVVLARQFSCSCTRRERERGGGEGERERERERSRERERERAGERERERACSSRALLQLVRNFASARRIVRFAGDG